MVWQKLHHQTWKNHLMQVSVYTSESTHISEKCLFHLLPEPAGPVSHTTNWQIKCSNRIPSNTSVLRPSPRCGLRYFRVLGQHQQGKDLLLKRQLMGPESCSCKSKAVIQQSRLDCLCLHLLPSKWAKEYSETTPS